MIAKNGLGGRQAAFLLIMLLSVMVISAIASARPVDVTVDITRFVQVEDPDEDFPDLCPDPSELPPIGENYGDYYARVLIGDTGHEGWHESDTIYDETDLSPSWTFTTEVETDDYPDGLIPVTIRIFDREWAYVGPLGLPILLPEETSDIIDLDPDDNDIGLELIYNPTTGTWTGDTTTGSSTGDGDVEHVGGEFDPSSPPDNGMEGGQAGTIYFDVTHTDFDRFYPTYDEIVEFLEYTSDTSPIAETYTIGSSADGRNLIALKISDNPDEEEDEPAFMYIGVIHGDEPLGVRVTLDLIEDLTQGYGVDPDVTNWVDAYEIWIIPVINPYGYDTCWRKNGPNQAHPNEAASGVDINRNFDFRWNYDLPIVIGTDDSYKGTAPASEPETQAIQGFVQDQRPAFGITFHSGYKYSNGAPNNDGIILSPWTSPGGWGPNILPSPDSIRIDDIANVIADAVQAQRGGTNRPTFDTAGAIGQSNIYNYAITGMFDYQLETNSDNDWVFNEFYNVDLDNYNAAQQANLNAAQAYVDAYLGGIRGLQDHFLLLPTGTYGGFTFTGPGVTGRVCDCLSGDGRSATVTVRPLDDINGDGVVDNGDLDYDSDGVADLAFRTSDPDYGRYLRLLPPGTYILTFDSSGYQPQAIQVTVLQPPPGGRVWLIDQNVAMDSGNDRDGDGLTDCLEVTVFYTNPENPDHDGDGLLDGEEVNVYHTDPTDSDTDNDGLTDGDEVNNHNTNPRNADSDNDLLSDGDEVNVYHTNPRDSDSDDDGLFDGQEINAYRTNPLDSDSDDDGLNDGDEVNVYETNPLDSDSDDDGLSDGTEIQTGTDPWDADSDGDGLLDGYDVEFIQNIINDLPASAFRNRNSLEGQRTAINSILNDVENFLVDGQNSDALQLLKNLRKHVDGDPNADNNDWIVENTARMQVRDLIDILINNLSA